MQVFEVSIIDEPPYMEAREIFPIAVQDSFDDSKVLILISHSDKRIWTYYGPKSSLKLQMFGGILAKKFRVQLKLFYRIMNMNEFAPDNKFIENLFEEKLGAGRAKEITSENYDEWSIPGEHAESFSDLCVHKGLNKTDAKELIDEIPKLQEYKIKYLIIGGDFYYYDSQINSFISKRDEKRVLKKIGEIPNGFFFDNSNNYSTRLIIKNGIVQTIEFYVPTEATIRKEQLNIPIFAEDKFQKPGVFGDVLNAFNIPEELPETSDDSDD